LKSITEKVSDGSGVTHKKVMPGLMHGGGPIVKVVHKEKKDIRTRKETSLSTGGTQGGEGKKKVSGRNEVTPHNRSDKSRGQSNWKPESCSKKKIRQLMN